MKRFSKILFSAFLLFLFLTVLTISAGMVVVKKYSGDLPDIDKLRYYQPSESTKLYSADNKLIGVIFKENRTWLSFEEIPKIVKQAVISVEDFRFYKHRGIDFIGIIRAFMADIRHEEVRQGASTITQQLARNVFLSPQVSVERKIKEIILSFRIEKKFTKDEILEFYLNQIYFGSGAYGIEAAAEIYFDKVAKDLTLPEAALLAGIPPAPSLYSPFVNFDKAKARQKIVLDKMVELRVINQAQADEAYNAELKFAKKRKDEFHNLKYPYFTTYVVNYLFNKYDSSLIFGGGLKVYTTLDTRLQEVGSKELNWGVNKGLSEGLNCHQGALVCLDQRNGFIKAMVGGLKFTTKDQFNRAWQARRQPGSAFKVFIYTAAIDIGDTPQTEVLDAPVSYRVGDKVWSPYNYDHTYWGLITYQRALQFSRNIPAVRVSQKIGIQRVVEYAYKMGIKEPLLATPSLALGAGVVTPLQMASAFGVLGNEGIRVEPTCIVKIVDSNGKVLEDNTYPYQKEVLPASTAYTMVEMLKWVIKAGTGTAANIGRAAAGKTGTSNEYRDAWFIGFTPQLSCAVWVGNDNYDKMYNSVGGYIPASIWGRFMKQALANVKAEDFFKPEAGKAIVIICSESRLRATPDCPQSVRVYMDPDKAKGMKYCKIHGTGSNWEKESGKQNQTGIDDGGETPAASPTTEQLEELPFKEEGITDEPAEEAKPAPEKRREEPVKEKTITDESYE